MNVWDVIAQGANRFFENIASELEYVQHFATVASVFPRISRISTDNKVSVKAKGENGKLKTEVEKKIAEMLV